MKVTRTTWTVEGTLAEIKTVLPQLDDGSAVRVTDPPTTSEASAVQVDATDDGMQVSRALVEFLKRVMTRREMPWGQRDLFAKLYAAGYSGLTRTELAPAMGRSHAEFSGVIGALGHRTANTPGHAELAARMHQGGAGLMLIIKPEGDDWRYALRPEARLALEELGKV